MIEDVKPLITLSSGMSFYKKDLLKVLFRIDADASLDAYKLDVIAAHTQLLEKLKNVLESDLSLEDKLSRLQVLHNTYYAKITSTIHRATHLATLKNTEMDSWIERNMLIDPDWVPDEALIQYKIDQAEKHIQEHELCSCDNCTKNNS